MARKARPRTERRSLERDARKLTGELERLARLEKGAERLLLETREIVARRMKG